VCPGISYVHVLCIVAYGMSTWSMYLSVCICITCIIINFIVCMLHTGYWSVVPYAPWPDIHSIQVCLQPQVWSHCGLCGCPAWRCGQNTESKVKPWSQMDISKSSGPNQCRPPPKKYHLYLQVLWFRVRTGPWPVLFHRPQLWLWSTLAQAALQTVQVLSLVSDKLKIKA